MKELRTEVRIQADPRVVWEILVDLEGYRNWNPFMYDIEGKIREGNRLRIRIDPPDGRAMTFRPTVTRVEEGREFRWLGRLVLPGLFDGEHIFELSEAESGSCYLVHRECFRGVLVPFFWKSMEPSTRRGFEAMNAALKERAETDGSGDGGD